MKLFDVSACQRNRLMALKERVHHFRIARATSSSSYTKGWRCSKPPEERFHFDPRASLLNPGRGPDTLYRGDALEDGQPFRRERRHGPPSTLEFVNFSDEPQHFRRDPERSCFHSVAIFLSIKAYKYPIITNYNQLGKLYISK